MKKSFEWIYYNVSFLLFQLKKYNNAEPFREILCMMYLRRFIKREIIFFP